MEEERCSCTFNKVFFSYSFVLDDGLKQVQRETILSFPSWSTVNKRADP